MSKQLNLHIIEHARALIADEAHWRRRQMAFDRGGGAVTATDSKGIQVVCLAHSLRPPIT